MKRKRGHKKGNKSKTPKSVSDQGNSNESAENKGSQNSEQSSGGATEHDNSERESRMEVDAPSSIGSDHSHNVGSTDRDGSADNMASKSVGRVKVKLKTSKVLEPDTSYNDTDKSSPQTGSERSGMASEKREENVLPPPERKPVFLGNVYRKTKGIKIKTSKVVAGTSSGIDNTSDAVKAQEKSVFQEDLKTPNEDSQTNKQEPESAPISLQKEQKTPDQTSRYNKQELEDSLTVIKKVMKMDAAEPFNVPVNPEALGIPDYFDIIDTPMDFGTICNNLEKGDKYMNSEGVYKDVQYIWDNCCKYNKKGDYIMDLMKRVKKNFMKYWTAAGLYTEQSTENAQLGDGAQWGKASTKSGQSKHKSHKRHGRHHKSDCMCAICILKRRKREREQSERTAKGQSGAQEDSSPLASPSVENSSLNMGEEQDTEVDVDNRTGGKFEIVQLDSPIEDKQRIIEHKQEGEGEREREWEGERGQDEEEKEIEIEKKIEVDAKDKTQSTDSIQHEEPSGQPATGTGEKLGVVLVSSEGQNSTQHEEEDKEIRLQKQKELERKEWKAKMHEKFRIENPLLLSLCGALFPDDNHRSVWSRPHSLLKKRRGSTQTSSLQKAVEALMK